MSRERLYVFDTTLRDGNQTQGVDFSVEDKRVIAKALDQALRKNLGKFSKYIEDVQLTDFKVRILKSAYSHTPRHRRRDPSNDRER